MFLSLIILPLNYISDRSFINEVFFRKFFHNSIILYQKLNITKVIIDIKNKIFIEIIKKNNSPIDAVRLEADLFREETLSICRILLVIDILFILFLMKKEIEKINIIS